jgi:hypothetical protein
MICPKCKRDYRDVPEGNPIGHFYRSDDHHYKDYRRFGMQCTNCGFVAEMITTATGDPYKKREVKLDPNTINMFGDEFEESTIIKNKSKASKQKVSVKNA